MTNEEKFVEALRKFSAAPSMVVPGDVVSVDEAGKTCTVKPLDGGPNFLGVKLKPTKNSKSGFWMIPTVGSSVLVGRINNKDTFTYLAMYSDVDKVIWITGTSKIEITSTGKISMTAGSSQMELSSTGVVMNKGALGGVPISKAIMAKLNLIEADQNALKALIGTLAGKGVNANTAGDNVRNEAFAPFSAWSGKVMIPTRSPELENPKVKHG